MVHHDFSYCLYTKGLFSMSIMLFLKTFQNQTFIFLYLLFLNRVDCEIITTMKIHRNLIKIKPLTKK